jgi:hypothetical protein
MTKSDCINYIEKMLEHKSSKYTDPSLQSLYERGYLVGLLAYLMMQDNLVARDIINRLNKK